MKIIILICACLFLFGCASVGVSTFNHQNRLSETNGIALEISF